VESIELREQINQLLTSKEITQADMARLSGVSDSIISSWKKGVYGGDNNAISNQLGNWLNQYRKGKIRSLAIPNFQWVKTTTGQGIIDAAEFIQDMGTILVIYGAPGTGKTEACKEYCNKHPNVVMMTASPSLNSVRAVYQCIADEMKLDCSTSGVAVIRRELIKRFKAMPKAMLIIDEAQHLKREIIEALRIDINGENNGNAAITLCGNETSYAQLYGNNSTYFARFSSRIGATFVAEAKTEDLAAILDGWEIVDAAQRKLLSKALGIPGHLRIVREVLRSAFNYANGLDRSELSMTELEKAWKDRADTRPGARS